MQEYLIDILDNLLAENNIAFIKWDMNRNVSEPGWPDAPAIRANCGCAMSKAFTVCGAHWPTPPTVMWQSCSGGGGRADLVFCVWPTKSGSVTTPKPPPGWHPGRLSQVYPANTMEALGYRHGTRLVPFAFRFHVSMLGVSASAATC